MVKFFPDTIQEIMSVSHWMGGSKALLKKNQSKAAKSSVISDLLAFSFIVVGLISSLCRICSDLISKNVVRQFLFEPEKMLQFSG